MSYATGTVPAAARNELSRHERGTRVGYPGELGLPSSFSLVPIDLLGFASSDNRSSILTKGNPLVLSLRLIRRDESSRRVESSIRSRSTVYMRSGRRPRPEAEAVHDQSQTETEACNAEVEVWPGSASTRPRPDWTRPGLGHDLDQISSWTRTGRGR